VKGKISDAKDKSPLIGAAAVLLKTNDSSIYKGSAADKNGNIFIENVSSGKYILKVSYIGYTNFFRNLEINSTPIELGNISLAENSTTLKKFTVVDKMPLAVQKGDTSEYNAGAYKTNPDATAEDLVGKMPSITSQNGTVQAQGENVQQVLVDGKPFFGNDANAVLKNLPAEIIDKIQVFDQKSDQSQFTGFDDGNTLKTINIVTKTKFRYGEFGKFYAGYADDNRYQVGGNLNVFNGDRRFTILAQSNNINQQNFSTEDLLGVTSSSGGGGGGRGGGGGNFGGGQGGGGGNSASNFLVNQQSGIATTNAIGLNYIGKWNKNVDVSASYFFNWSNTATNTNLLKQYVLPSDSGLNYNEKDASVKKNINNRANLRLDYKIDSMNSILFRPKISVQQNSGNAGFVGENVQQNILLNTTNSQNNSNLTGINLSGPLLYRHKFHKRGRTLSLSVNPGYSTNTGPAYQFSGNRYYTDTLANDTLNQKTNLTQPNVTVVSNVMYTEPLGGGGRNLLQFNYGDNYSKTNSNLETFNYSPITNDYTNKDTILSSTFQTTYLAQNVGTGYRYQSKKVQLSFGASFQVAKLSNETQFPPPDSKTNETFQSVLPNLMFRYNFPNKSNLRIFYRTSNSPPSGSQLQNVLNNNNPLQLSIGNPNLKQDYEHNVTIRYSAANADKANAFFILFSGNYYQNYMGSSTIIANPPMTVDNNVLLQNGSQFTMPVNIDGYYSLKSFVVYSIPFTKIKSSLHFNASVNYSQTPGLINNQINYSDAPSGGLGVTLSSNVSTNVDFTVSSNSNLNYIENTLQKQLNSNYFTQTSSVKLNLIFLKNVVFNTVLTHQYYAGLSQNYNQDYILWNCALGYKFLKDHKGDIRLSVFDVLNQNKNIQRTVSNTYIQDTQTNVLQRYFMLIFTYNLKVSKKNIPPTPSKTN
jgi:hypothetical protein